MNGFTDHRRLDIQWWELKYMSMPLSRPFLDHPPSLLVRFYMLRSPAQHASTSSASGLVNGQQLSVQWWLGGKSDSLISHLFVDGFPSMLVRFARVEVLFDMLASVL